MPRALSSRLSRRPPLGQNETYLMEIIIVGLLGFGAIVGLGGGTLSWSYRSRRYRQLNYPKLVESVESLPRFVGYEYIQAPQISTRHHFLRCLALLLLQSQSSRY
ncbi:MAG: hypothetical protein ACI9GB_003605 [Halioglobus sp.]